MSSKPISEIIQTCEEENAARKPQSASCFEVFRLALVEGSQEAWTAIRRIYENLLLSWVARYSLFRQTGEDAELFVNDALTRFWRWGSKPAAEGKFGTLGEYLQYLKRCTWSSIDDYLRKLKRDGLWGQIDLEEKTASSGDLAEDTDHQIEIQALFAIVWEIVQGNKAEEIMAEESWIYGLRPREIYKKHSDTFKDMKEVNQTKLNIIRRLKRHPEIKGFFDEVD